MIPIFLHIPKTAGTTLVGIIHRNLSQENIWQVYGQHVIEPDFSLPENWDKIKLIRGHFVYGIHKYVPYGYGYWYFTLLRNPVDRVVSLWRYIKRNETHPLRPESLKMNLVEFVESGIYANSDNGMTMMLAGLRGEIPVMPWARLEGGEVNNEDFSVAVSNLKTFRFVGVCEKFRECLQPLGTMLGWRDYHFENINVAPGRYEVKPEERRIVEQHNRYDMELYKMVSGGGL